MDIIPFDTVIECLPCILCSVDMAAIVSAGIASVFIDPVTLKERVGLEDWTSSPFANPSESIRTVSGPAQSRAAGFYQNWAHEFAIMITVILAVCLDLFLFVGILKKEMKKCVTWLILYSAMTMKLINFTLDLLVAESLLGSLLTFPILYVVFRLAFLVNIAYLLFGSESLAKQKASGAAVHPIHKHQLGDKDSAKSVKGPRPPPSTMSVAEAATARDEVQGSAWDENKTELSEQPVIDDEGGPQKSFFANV